MVVPLEIEGVVVVVDVDVALRVPSPALCRRSRLKYCQKL